MTSQDNFTLYLHINFLTISWAYYPKKIPALHREVSKLSSSMKANNLGKKPTLPGKILITFEICLNPRVSDYTVWSNMVQYYKVGKETQ